MDEDDMYGAGSDDFRCYLWKIPSLISLQGLRKEITADDWYTQEWPDIVGEYIQLYVMAKYSPEVHRITSVCRRQAGKQIRTFRNRDAISTTERYVGSSFHVFLDISSLMLDSRAPIGGECCRHPSVSTIHCHFRYRIQGPPS
jgi:hypothetical protein